MKIAENEDVAAAGEALACAYLEERGWDIVDRNWAQEVGELDVVARRTEPWGEIEVTTYAFVEVKTREVSRGPLPEVRVDHAKRRKLVTLAQLYLARQRLRHVNARFDVIGVDLDTEEVRHHPAAFDIAGRLR